MSVISRFRTCLQLAAKSLAIRPLAISNFRISYSTEVVSKSNEPTPNPHPPPPKYTKRRTNLLFTKYASDFFMLLLCGFGGYSLYKKYQEKTQNEKDLEFSTVLNFKYKLFRKKDSDFMLPEFLVRNLDNFKNFKLRKDDVWIVSFPKSGTTWLQEIVFLIMNECDVNKAKEMTIEWRVPFFEYETPGLKYIENQPIDKPRILKTHLPKHFLPDDIEQKAKLIYITRNPKDVVVSYFNFVKMSTQAGYTGNFDDFAELFIEGKVPYGPWWTHLNEYLSMMKNVHVICYEDLQTAPHETIRKLCDFLGKNLSDEKVNTIVEWCSYENMKSNPKVNYEWYKEFGLFKKDGQFLRKGIVGDWLNYFNPNLSKRFDNCIKDNLKATNIVFNYGISDDDQKKIHEYYSDVKNKINP